MSLSDIVNRSRVGLALAISTCAALGLCVAVDSHNPAQAQSAPSALAVGKTRWPVLGGNTGAGAKAFGDQLDLAGYATTIDTNGRFTDQVFNDVRSKSVVFLHGHGHAGNITTEDTSATGENQYFLAQIPPTLTWDLLPPPQYVEWDDYLPASEIDGLLLAVLSSCETAETHETWGSLPGVLKAKGVDTSVTMFGQPLIPSADSTTPLSYGNYFWARAGYYLRTGNTVGSALAKALQDLIAKEGTASGWNRTHISGAASSPSTTKILPPRPGATVIPPVGLLPGSAATLTETSTKRESLATGDVIDSDTTAGITIRRDAETGILLGAWGSPTLAGSDQLSTADAAELAREFLAAEAGAPIQIVDSRSTITEPVEGARTLATEFVFHDGIGREGFAVVEVDLRMGKVVSYAHDRSEVTPVPIKVSRQQAIDSALALVGGGRVVETTIRTWTDTRWVVTIEQEANDDYPRIRRVSIDADNGRIIDEAIT